MAELEGLDKLKPAMGYVVAGAFTLFSFAAIVGVFVSPVPDEDKPRRLPLPGTAWGPMQAIFFLLFYVFLQNVLGGGAIAAQHGAVKRAAEGTALERWIDDGLLTLDIDSFVGSLLLPVAGLILIVAVFCYVSSLPPHTLRSLGVRQFPSRQWQFHIFALSASIIAPILAVGWLWTLALSKLGFSDEAQEVVRDFANAIEAGDAPVVVLGVFNAVILAPIVEEVLFRGLLYGALRKYFGIASAITVTSLVFALIHANVAAFLPIGLLSAILCGAYEKRGSIWDPMMVHALFNTTSLVLLSFFRPP